LKRWEELGLEQYLANSKQAYLNQIETLEEQLKNHE
jgi:hypothetical protein